MSGQDGEMHDRAEKRTAGPGMLERLRGLFGFTPASIRDDIEEALGETGQAGVFSPQERSMLRNVLDLHDLRVEDVMVPRADIIAVNLGMTLGEVLTVFRTAGHSRLPVHGDTLDDARGMVHIRDFVAFVATAPETAPAQAGMDLGPALMGRKLADTDILRPVIFAPPSMQALDLLVRMQTFRTHMALVIDEYGGTDGLVSIEDIVERIVGDIEDEHDESESPKITMALDGSYIADARAGLDEVSKILRFDLVSDGESEEVDTLGGLIGALAGHVPGRGEIIRGHDHLEFEILDADPRRVKRVRITHVPSQPAVDIPAASDSDASSKADPVLGPSDQTPLNHP